MQMLILLAIAWPLSDSSSFRWLLAICSYILFFTGIPTTIARHVLPSPRSKYLRAEILLFFPILALAADLLQYALNPNLVFDGTYSGYHFLNPFRTLSNWSTVESYGWQYRPLVMGMIGLLAYLDLYRMGRLEDKRAAAQN
jgi:hypothetical protein